MIYKLIISGRLPGLNEYTAENRKNRFAGAKMKKNAESLILVEIKRQLDGVKIYNPVILRFTWVEANRRRDLDNIAFARKFIQDALVASGVLSGDGWANISGFSDCFKVDKKSPRIEVDIEEANDE